MEADSRGRSSGPTRGSGPSLAADDFELVFLPLHKRALGMAFGIVAGLVMFVLTIYHVVATPPAPDISLLAEYFYGYRVTWAGAFIGLFWGGVVGFVSGWFLAFSRNLVVATSIFLTKTRAELLATRDFLDHI